jgi:acyl transferase domain-containing protein
LNSSDPTLPVPVAIIGMGCMFPQAEDLARYWANICNKVDAITDVPESHWSVADYYDHDPKAPDRTYAHRGGFLTPVDFPLLDFGIAPHSVEATDSTQLLGLLVARAALEDAGCLSHPSLDRDRVSVILGVTGTLELVIPLGARLGHPIWRRALEASGVDKRTTDQVVARIASSYVGWQENSFPGLLGNVAAGRIANRLDLRGTNCVVDAACASSLAAVNLAVLELAAGRSDLAVTGGLDTFNDIFMYMCFSKTPALSPAGDARPFDADADGTILGEGLGVLVLKRLADAQRDGDRIYAVIRSIGTSSDGAGQAVYAPSPAGQAQALSRAYQLAGISPGTVELVEAHGTGTKVGDAAELAALESVYRGQNERARTWCALGSVKSQVGHTKAAAGAAGLIKAALALHHKVLPPTAKVRRPIDSLATGGSPFYVNTEPRPWLESPDHPRRAAVSAFGFGGSNFHCLLEEATGETAGPSWDGDVQIVAYSGNEPGDIHRALDVLEGLFEWAEVRAESALCRAHFRAEHRIRLLLVIERGNEDLRALCNVARSHVSALADGTMRPSEPMSTQSLAGRVFVGTGARTGSLAMLFPGQGSQYLGMLRGLACQFPRMREALALLDAVAAHRERPLSDWIYPQAALDDETRRAGDLALRETQIAQPAIGGVSLGLLRILGDFGVRPGMVGGHSFGELLALCASGRIDDRSLLKLALVRGEVMAACARESGPGAMLAAFASAGDVRALVRECSLEVIVANDNAPRQCVLSGPVAAIERARQVLAERQISSHAVPVSAAFHCALVAGAEQPLRSALDEIALAPALMPVFSNSTAAPYPSDADSARALLAGQLARPVEFVAQVEAMYAMGARTFVEVGPDSKLTGLVRAILGTRDHVACAVDSSHGSTRNDFDLACVLSTLAAQGYAVDLSRWDEGSALPRSTGEKKAALTVKISGANARPKLDLGDAAPAQHAASDMNSPSGAQSLPVASSPRFWTGNERAGKRSQVSKRSQSEIENRMNSCRSEGVFHTNGQAAAKEHSGHEHEEPSAPAPSGSPSTAARDGLALALAQSQENLTALEKLARETARLHQQFLEGQEKTQQTFLKLIEQQERVALALLDPVPGLAPAPLQRADASEFVRHDRNGQIEPARALPIAKIPIASAESLPVGPRALSFEFAASSLIEVVALKTGYPTDVIGIDMQLDADLGIDSIKRVEILSAWQERLPELAAVKPEELGSFRTLRALVEFMTETEPSPRPDLVPRHESNGQAHVSHASDHLDGSRVALIEQVLIAAVADKTGYPAGMLELDMRLDVDLGIDSIKRVEILSAVQERLPDAPALAPEQLGSLGTLREIATALEAELPRAPRPTPAVERHAEESNVHANGVARPAATAVRRSCLSVRALVPAGDRAALELVAGATIWVASDGSPLTDAVVHTIAGRGYQPLVVRPGENPGAAHGNPPHGLIVIAPLMSQDEAWVKRAFQVVRAAGPALQVNVASGGAVLLLVARLDGYFGVAGLPATVDPGHGALAGIAKTAALEWPAVSCKAVDLDRSFESHVEAARLIVEELFVRGPTEVGISARGRVALELKPVETAGALRGGSIRLAPGDLVVASGGARGITASVALALARAYQPTLALFGRTPAPPSEPEWTDAFEDEAELKQAIMTRSDRRAGPRELRAALDRALAEREIRHNIGQIEALGSKVIYRSVDLRDREAVRAALRGIQREHGPVRGLIHGAGVLADRRIIDQADDQFDLVYDTKVKGLHHLFHALDPEELSFLMLFSSSTARFGRAGQVAYAAANEVLNKWAQQQATILPGCRVISYNWGPWAGGMVNDGLKALFESEGLALIAPDAGAQVVVDDLRGPGPGSVEVVALAEACAPVERKPTPESQPERRLEPVFDRTVDLASLPVLAAHVIDSHAVLPMALMIEWLAEAAVHRNPGMVVGGLDGLRLFKGVILSDRSRQKVKVRAGRGTRNGAGFLVPVELVGNLAGGREVTHARADVVLADRAVIGQRRLSDPVLAPYAIERDDIYETILFHGPDLQGIVHVDGCGESAVAGWVATAPLPEAWIERPLRTSWLTEPLAIDSAFQLVVLWCRERLGANSLPTAIGSYRQFRRAFPSEGVRVVAAIKSASDTRVVADIEFLDGHGELAARLDDYECVVDAALNLAFRRNQLAPTVPVVPS